ncbi:hypothetical protein B0T22DRAFT_445681 [Podospora appendiculata]|uniref:Uncharacterized protein n=1 Tax=Podospora appendiculata TaxID=314037 RepID=A0AAE1C746_9PEZI|nr:hypothetical protein B0T22DRAFT_445681 [Podospora appendiculata]
MPPITLLKARPPNVYHNLEAIGPQHLTLWPLNDTFPVLRSRFNHPSGIPYPNGGLGISYLFFSRGSDNVDRVLIVKQSPHRFKYSHTGLWELPTIVQSKDRIRGRFGDTLARALAVELGIYCRRYIHYTRDYSEFWFRVRDSPFGYKKYFLWTILVDATTAHSAPLLVPSGDEGPAIEVQCPKIERRPASENPLGKDGSPYYTEYRWVTEEQCKDSLFEDPENPGGKLMFGRNTKLQPILDGFEWQRRSPAERKAAIDLPRYIPLRTG